MAKTDLSAFTPETWKQFQDYKAALAAAAEDTGKLHTNVDGLLTIMANAGTEGERLANALKGGPLNVAITLAIDALNGLFAWIEKAQSKQRQMIAELQEFNKFQHEVIRAGGDMYENARKTMETIAGAEAKIHSLNEQLKSLENIAKVYDAAQSDRLQNGIDLRHGEYNASLSNINLLETMGEISPDEATQQRIEANRMENLATIQDRVTKAESDYNSTSSNYEEELKYVGGKEAFSPKAIGAATDALSQAQGRYNQAQILAGPEGQAQLDELDRKIKANKGGSWEQNQELQKQRGQLAKEIKEAQDNLSAYRNAVASAQQHLDDLKGLPEKFEKMETELNVLRQKRDDARNLAPKLSATANEDASAASLAAEIKSGHLNKKDLVNSIIADVYGIESGNIQGGRNLDSTQIQTLNALLVLLEKVHLNSQSILQVITDGLRKNEPVEQLIEEIGSQLNSFRNTTGGG